MLIAAFDVCVCVMQLVNQSIRQSFKLGPPHNSTPLNSAWTRIAPLSGPRYCSSVHYPIALTYISSLCISACTFIPSIFRLASCLPLQLTAVDCCGSERQATTQAIAFGLSPSLQLWKPCLVSDDARPAADVLSQLCVPRSIVHQQH